MAAVAVSSWEQGAHARLRTSLHDARRRLLDSALWSVDDAPHVDPDDRSDEIDLATVEHSHFVLLSAHERDLARLRAIDAALERMEDGSFGTCDRCGQEIGLERLAALPVTTRCVNCQEERERVLRRSLPLAPSRRLKRVW
jgi:DnaK suppressor protein